VNSAKKRLFLFDIDGTLITAGGAGARSLDRAFYALFGIGNAFKSVKMSGKTDIQIIKEGLRLHELPCVDGTIEKMKAMYLEFLREEINNPWKKMKPGIAELLALLKDDAKPLGLLTGNLEDGAGIKLKPFGLNKYFMDGAFGSDHEERDELLPIAIKKFSRKGLAFSPTDCIVVGDTPRDVRCAKIYSALSVAVATGPYSKEELLRTEADIVLESFEEAEKCAVMLGRI
jgi:phosphoglycolate phosphatase